MTRIGADQRSTPCWRRVKLVPPLEKEPVARIAPVAPLRPVLPKASAPLEHDREPQRAILRMLGNDTDLYGEYSENLCFKKYLADFAFTTNDDENAA